MCNSRAISEEVVESLSAKVCMAATWYCSCEAQWLLVQLLGAASVPSDAQIGLGTVDVMPATAGLLDYSYHHGCVRVLSYYSSAPEIFISFLISVEIYSYK